MPGSMTRSLSRRAFVGQASGAGLVGLGSALELIGATSSARATPTFEAYHALTPAAHQANSARLSAQGYRPISLSVYGRPPNVLYAAVWVARAGPSFAAVYSANSRDYQAAIDSWSARGYAPTLVSAVGPAGDPLFAAVFEQNVPGPWKARHGLTDAAFVKENQQARDEGQILRWVCLYGDPGDRRYIAVWHSNANGAKWQTVEHATLGEYQPLFDARAQIPRFHLACISVASDQTLSAVFNDEGIGIWVARHNMSSTDYLTEVARQRAAGGMPICVQGGGIGNAVRYAAVFAAQDQPSARMWTAAGPQAPDMTVFDGVVRAFMARHGVRAAQLTIAQNGVNKLQRAYTWAEPDYRTAHVSDRFLLASISKMFVNACCRHLYETGKLQPTSLAYKVIGFSNPKDRRSDTITVQQLLDHTAGFRYDATYDMRAIALARNLPGPARMRDIAAHVYARDLDYPPGSPPGGEKLLYNNYGYLLAALIVEHVSGQSYMDFLRANVLQRDGITEVEPYPTAPAPRPAGLVSAEDNGVGLSALSIHSAAPIPTVFGGDGMVKETAIGSCGLAASATALTQFIRRNAAWGIGGRNQSARSGSTPGTSSFAQSLKTGTDWALVMNTRNFQGPPQEKGKEFDGLIDAINREITRAGL
jgi:CubicO group peptidase (beta-lactamase class C family)